MKKNVKIVVAVLVAILLLFSLLFLLFNNRKYEVTIQDANGKTVERIKVDKNSKIEDLKIPEKEGYEFLYWTIDDKVVDSSYKINKNVVLVPVYREKYEADDYTVTFDTDGGNEIEAVVVMKDNFVLEPNIPEKDGFVFVKWELNGETYDFNTPVTSDITLKAIWEKVDDKKVYTVTFDTDGGEKVQAKQVIENSKVEVPSKPIKVGYTFKEWQLNGKKYDFNKPVISDITLKAVWVKNANDNTIIVSFDTDGGSKISYQRIEKGKKVQRPSNPSKSGYVFVEWQLNGKKYDFDSSVTKSITLKAVWEKVADKKVYTVTFDTVNGSSVKAQTVVAGNKASKPSNPTRNGYAFVEWQLNGKAYDFNASVNSNITLKAVWRKNESEPTPTTYTVKFDANGGSSVSSQIVKKGEKVSAPSNPTYSGHTFNEWQLNGKKYDFNTPVISDITLKATWTNNDWDINSSGEIIKYKGSQTEVVIPNKIDSITPVKILSGAFENNSLKKVWLASSITTVEANAFNKVNNQNLLNIYISDAQFSNNNWTKALNLTGKCTSRTKKGTFIKSEISKGGTLCGGSHRVSNYALLENIDGIYPIKYDISACITGVSVSEVPYYLSTEEYELYTPVFSGYTFNGWTGEGITKPTKKVVIPAGSKGEKSYKASCTKK